ncbi:MAG: hypothetical protein HYY84_00910 [Deltaproteobacteria bacterium]|nr:hypothetical protein [Deltaproteobacteria bacterium]
MTTKVGLMLVAENIVSRAQLEDAIARKLARGGTIGWNLVQCGFIDEGFLVNYYCRKFKVPFADDALFRDVQPQVISTIPRDMVAEFSVVPIALEQDALYVAMADPSYRHALDEIGFFTGMTPRPMVAKDSTIAWAMKTYYGVALMDGNGARAAPTGGASATTPETPSAVDALSVTSPPSRRVLGDIAKALESPIGFPKAFSEDPSADTAPAIPIVRESGGSARIVAPGEVIVGGVRRPAEGGSTVPGIAGVPRRGTTNVGPTPNPDPGASSTSLQTAFAELLGRGADARSSRETESARDAEMTPTPEVGAGVAAPAVESSAPLPSEVTATMAVPTTTQSGVRGRADAAAFREATNRLEKATDRNEIARAIELCALTVSDRVALFVVKNAVIVGWHGSGPGFSPERLKSIILPKEGNSTLANVVVSGQVWSGRFAASEIDDALVDALGGVRPASILVVPVMLRDRVVCLIYCEAINDAARLNAAAPLFSDLARVVATSFERAIRVVRKS